MAPQSNDTSVLVPSSAVSYPSSLDTSSTHTSFLHSYDKVLSTSRKLRKSCSLPNCSQRPGECMHCTCDGRCGQHEGGKCGVRREGSGKSCKRLGCPKDETCLHSTRATCCHCRNLVSSQSRSMKAKRATDDTDTSEHLPSSSFLSDAAMVLSPVAAAEKAKLLQDKKRKRDAAMVLAEPKSAAVSSSSSTPKAKKPKTAVGGLSSKPTAAAAVPATMSSSATTPVCGVPSLVEHPEWFRRRHTCNLVVVVEGTQFNLHKFPMLIACPELRTKMPSSSATEIAVLKYAHFPGGAAAFELACIYAYTGSMDVNATNVALLYCAARILKMHVKLTSRCATLLETLAQTGSGIDVVHMLLQVVEIRKCLRNQSTDRMMALCVNAIAQRYPYETPTMHMITKLPCDVFLHITQLVLNDKPNATVNNVVARLCAQAHLAQVFRSVQPTADKAAELGKVLDILLSIDPDAAMLEEGEEGEVVEDAEMKIEATIASALGVSAPSMAMAAQMLTAQ
ncbi:Aste57867_967 [Aphanomyces stellatus]|uniref:Aste57867_967 protein n=1 Tax=Aphanomyces stellatus TaxID=120398 RepID=A0A485K9G2_9STRA|nr:hypothetical protein As57867_000966 [Aphanomyces stellatus]VFT78189.1 Aste57867_967 [Aphanomyces stellatus]